MEKKPGKNVERLVGLAASFSLIVGFLAFIGAVVAFFSGEYSAAGINMIAAALGFGLFSVAVLSG